jgi:Cu2+-exporting ATPase
MKVVKQVFPVTGMSCASCAVSIEKLMNAQKGIIHAAVNYANSNVLVEYDSTAANLPQITKVVQASGYTLITQTDTYDAEQVSADNYKLLKQKTIVAVVCSAPLAYIGMFAMNMPGANYIMWALATPVLFFSGARFFTGAWQQAHHRIVGMDMLVALSTGVAYIFSIFNTLLPHFWMNRGMHGHVYFEASAVVITFILLGKLLEDRAKASTTTAIKKLAGLQPKTVTRIMPNDRQEIVDITQVVPGDVLLVKPGERVAADGRVQQGTSFVDESMMTGEPVPVEKKEGSNVFSGTINQTGSFRYVAVRVGEDTMLANIIKMVQEAQGSKAPIQQLTDKIAAIFVPVVLGIAALTFGVWAIWGGANGISMGFSAFVTVLVIACPCALGLATPTALVAGIGKGAEQGILIKDAQSLEMACKVTAVAMDKTGTLTYGLPEVAELVWAATADPKQLEGILMGMEQMSEHPLAAALVKHLDNKGVTALPIKSFCNIPGGGITGLNGHTIYFAGSEPLMRSMNIVLPDELLAGAEQFAASAHTVIWLSDHSKALGLAALADKIKPTSTDTVRSLQEMGVTVYMLTGDNEHTAKAVARKTGITHYEAGAMPADKAKFIRSLQAKGEIVAMVGDGINDSEALAQADVSIAMGKGADIARDVAGITIISSDPAKISKAIRLSQRTNALIRQNLFWAFVYNVIGIPVAAGILYPVNGFLLNPMIAGAAMAMSSVSVVLNSLRLKWAKI